MARATMPWGGLAIAVLLATRPAVYAQRIVTKNDPRPAEAVPAVTGIFPPGFTIGTTTECTVSGRNLTAVDRYRISGRGVTVAEIKSKSPSSAVLSVRTDANAEPGFRELRAESPDGFSNLVMVRVDTLAQTPESEPNDAASQANDVALSKAVVGILTAQDVDHFRIRGKAGQRITLDVEAQRLGTPVTPIVTVLASNGAALAQGREGRGGEHDCRLSYTLPKTGSYLIQLRDNLYGGSASSCYRLRIDETPYATGLFPLGGPRKQTIKVTASGGNLHDPRTKRITLPDEPGAIVEPGSFDGTGGAALAPGRLIVGDGPEVFESPPDPLGQSTTPLAVGSTANGRLDKPGEIDRYAIKVKKDDRVRIRVQASLLGSWLDSVLTLRDAAGNLIEENDDPGNANQRNGGFFGIPDVPPDSAIDYTAKADGTVTIEVADRYAEGGPEYAYRLSVGSLQPDFSIVLLLGNPSANRQLAVAGRRLGTGGPGSTGAFNIKPGSSTPVNFLITPEGRPGPVVVKIEGLPEGVTAEPVTVRFPSAVRSARTTGQANPAPAGGALVLKVTPNAEPVVGDLRIVATAKLEDGTVLRRVATALLSIDLASGGAQAPAGGAQTAIPLRAVTHIPVKVAGIARPVPAPGSAAPAGPIALSKVTVPGVLLQGGRIELALGIDPPNAPAKSYKIQAHSGGRGLTVTGPMPASSDSAESNMVLRVQAAVDAPQGVSPLEITFKPEGKEPSRVEVPLIVRPPIRVSVRPEPIVLEPNGTAELWVGVEREPGYSGPVELRVTELPDGVRAPGRFVVRAGENGGVVRLVRGKQAKRIVQVAARVSGVVRMPQGAVSVDSAIRPMVTGRSAEE